MSLTSMTGFSRHDGSCGDSRFAIEIRAVNGRGLDLRFRVPPGHEGLEARMRQRLSEALARGNVSLSLALTRETSGARVVVNTALLDQLVEIAARYADRPGLRPASVDGLLGVRGVVEVIEAGPEESDRQALDAALASGFEVALADFLASRKAEGRALATVLADQVDEIERLVGEAQALPARGVDAIRARIADMIEQVLARDDFDPARLHQEAALIATRADVREELDRLTAHIAQARALMAGGGAVGRRLDFLAQEFNREANTLCSKSNDTALTRIGLALKAVVDQFKEQVQNVE